MSDTPERVAREFHDAYEALAPEFGYTTRPETRVFDPTSPNGRLMVAVCAALQLVRKSRLREVEAERDTLASVIGSPPDGSHPDEWKPRAETWHHERANWAAEVERIRQANVTLHADLVTLAPFARKGLDLSTRWYGTELAARAVLDRLDKGGA